MPSEQERPTSTEPVTAIVEANAIVAVPHAQTSLAPTVTTPPVRQLSELTPEELHDVAAELGIGAAQFKTRQHLIAAIHERRQLVAATDRDAMMDVVRWGRRSISPAASKEQLALEIARIRSMRFAGLSQRGLYVLARLRGLEIRGDETVPHVVKLLKKQEGIFQKLNRKRRTWIGSVVGNMLGETEATTDEHFAAPQPGGAAAGVLPTAKVAPAPPAPRSATIKEDIEESGLFGGIANRVKKSADSYVNQKLDEIEARIDRKLDEIDRRLGEWRDKEIANRIRILKITLWASVIVGAFSLIYSYVNVYIVPRPAATTQQVVR